MKFFRTIFILSFLLILSGSFNSSNIDAQVRNPVLEFCTGTWCQWCPCGHDIIETQVLHFVPNTIIIAYHGGGSDPYKNFNGNEILSLLGMSSYPSGTADRTIAPRSRGEWPARILSRKNVAPTVEISVNKVYNAATRSLSLTAEVTALEELTGDYYLNFILLENGLIHQQTGNGSCTGGTNYVHDHVVRDMINGALGGALNNGETWAAGEKLTVTAETVVSTNYRDGNCELVALVYENASPLNVGEIQQAEKYELITPEKFSISYDNIALEDTLGADMAFYVEVENTSADTIVMDFVRTVNNLPDEWTSSLCFDVCFPPELDSISTTEDFASSPLAPGETRELSLHFFPMTNAGNGEVTLIAKVHGNDEKIDTVTFTATAEAVVSVEDEINELHFALEQNYPNPFNPETNIFFELPESGVVNLGVYDLLGQKVADIISGFKTKGSHEVTFNASNLSSGVYIYKLTAGEFSVSKKMSVLK